MGNKDKKKPAKDTVIAKICTLVAAIQLAKKSILFWSLVSMPSKKTRTRCWMPLWLKRLMFNGHPLSETFKVYSIVTALKQLAWQVGTVLLAKPTIYKQTSGLCSLSCA